MVVGALCRNGRRECFVEGDGEGFELFAAGCVDHLDEDLGAFEGRGVGVVLEVFDVVEEIPGKSGVRSDGGGLEAEVVIVLDDLFVDVALLEGNGGEGDLGPVGGLEGEEPAVDVVEGGGWDLVVVRRDELHADFAEVERGVGVVGDDDSDGDEGVANVGEAEEVAVVLIRAGIDGDGDVVVGVAGKGGVLIGWQRGRGLFGERESGRCEEACGNEKQKNCLQVAYVVGLHGQVDYHLRWWAGKGKGQVGLILAIYSALLGAVLVLGLPWWLARMTTSGRYRAGLAGRLGVIPKGLSEAVAGRKVVWLHAVSVGEVMAASELVRELRARLPGWVIAVSTTTETGQRLARERFTDSPVFYLPLDFAFVVRRYLQMLHPSLLILMESELWPNLMNVCSERGVRVAVVNARVSDRSLPRYLRLRRLWRPLLERVSVYLAQSEENARRLVQIGAPEKRVRVAGNLKYDVRASEESAMTKLLRERLPSGTKVLVAGSTLDGEETMLLGAWPRVLESVPGAVMLLAPRRPERFGTVAGLVSENGFTMKRASELREQGGEIASGSVVLLDTIGDLASAYSLGAAAFVGGSLVAAGGHNPLEPARFGVPVVMGESSENFREIVEAMRAAKGISIVRPEGLADGLVELMREGTEAQKLGERGREVFDAQAGATARTVETLLELVGEARA